MEAMCDFEYPATDEKWLERFPDGKLVIPEKELCRFMKWVNKLGPIERPELGRCWQWMGRPNGEGYGCASVCGIRFRAHRLSYELHVGKIPNGLLACHHCDNRMCVRPDHLFTGTSQDNAIDMVKKGRHYTGHRGENNWRHVFTEQRVVEIRARYEAGGISMQALADELRVDRESVRKAIRRITWKHVV